MLPCGGPSIAVCGSSTKLFMHLRKPMVAPCLPAGIVHALLHDHPVAVVNDDEAVEVETEAILKGGTVDLGDTSMVPHVPPSGLASVGAQW